MTQVDKLFDALKWFGLGFDADTTLPEREVRKQKRIIKNLIEEGYTPAFIYRVMKYGMPNIWPFKDGAPFDAVDLRDNFLKAAGSYQKQKKMGRVPDES